MAASRRQCSSRFASRTGSLLLVGARLKIPSRRTRAAASGRCSRAHSSAHAYTLAASRAWSPSAVALGHDASSGMRRYAASRALRASVTAAWKLAVVLNQPASRRRRASASESSRARHAFGACAALKSSRCCAIRLIAVCFILPTTCSIVWSCRLHDSLSGITMMSPASTRGADATSSPVRGAKRISRSVGNWERYVTDAPRSIMPMRISKTIFAIPETGGEAMPLPLPPLSLLMSMLRFDASYASPCMWMYSSATRRSVVVDMKPSSMPPHTPCSFGVQNASGSTPFATPR